MIDSVWFQYFCLHRGTETILRNSILSEVAKVASFPTLLFLSYTIFCAISCKLSRKFLLGNKLDESLRGVSTIVARGRTRSTLAVFMLEDALSVWTNLGKHLLFVWLFVSGIKTGTRRIIRLDELFSVVHRSRRITKDNSSRRIMRLVPVFY